MDAINQDLGFVITFAIFVLVILSTSTVGFFRQRGRQSPAVRPIAAYDNLSEYIANSVEANRPLHMSFGSSGIGGNLTLLTIASAEFFYQIAQRTTISDVAPIITLSDPSTLPVAQDTLRRAYRRRGEVERFGYTRARWYPTDSRSLTFAAALTAMISDERVSSNFLAGSFGPEIALIMEAGLRHDAPSIGMSDQLQGQAIAYAFSEHVLIGEEVFAAGSYLSDKATYRGETLAIDTLRWVLISILIGLLIARFIYTGA